MITFNTILRVRYCDTDQMGFTHHSNYVKYFEEARMELLTHIGMPYSDIEAAGFIMPVVDIKIHYLKPSFFDNELMVETTLLPLKGPRVIFQHRITNDNRLLICEGETVLVFAGKESKKACHPPAFFTDALLCADV